MNPEIINVKPAQNYQLLVTFANQEKRLFDVLPFIEKGGVFSELKDKDYFKKAFVSFGSLAWPNEQDLSNDTVFLLSSKLESKTKETKQTRHKELAV